MLARLALRAAAPAMAARVVGVPLRRAASSYDRAASETDPKMAFPPPVKASLAEKLTPQQMVEATKPVVVDSRTTWCDGGDPLLGHPRVYINLDKARVMACGYCGKRFVNSHHADEAAAESVITAV
eukprot:TRINITY_DN88_c0_g1_i2.p5 TRINITY_DN88_c0_g1~~TRINITY_DN88_c0_g1_i2.p5  ORF type:complete len:126 (+),score=33.06 TRINITY_DN88_c0_g1_i2:485-862(+)